MMTSFVRGTSGYRDHVEILVPRYEALSADALHADTLAFLPEEPSDVLDIGAATGRDAAWFARAGHRVLAIEPTEGFLVAAQKLHPSPAIDWLEDSVPDLIATRATGRSFDLIMMTAVWMHLDEGERQKGFPHVAGLLREGGTLIMSLRHGPVPEGRCMFDVSAEETIRLAAKENLSPVSELHTRSIQDHNRRADVTWTKLVFRKQPRGTTG